MRNLLLSICFLSLPMYAQQKATLHVTEQGTFLTDEGKEYAIIENIGKTANELFDSYKATIEQLYATSQDEIKLSENCIIVSGIDADEIKYGDAWSGIRRYNMNYTLKFMFKDNKVRVEVPRIKVGGKVWGKYDFKDWSIINKQLHLFNNGEIRSNNAKKFVEKINNDINSYIEVIIQKSNTKDNSDW